ncbi:MBL fold metallo-hydrolase [Acinetobacter sp. C26M]|uniref:MBL fold metallo-hydrolase n=1 Tax=unclassified Acinetobacter TaxID=196816 RepID=UPI00203684D5|nr:MULTISPECIES: MBL fold metallo-hydrolase [unclassified Acinetobacter]USA46538.1 MBL fold metallo-hydrolase [Acinetobacter sp. C26M]USA50022.1 MBL fold metallo-hydrolase [Acinetobacter sp. C26G]
MLKYLLKAPEAAWAAASPAAAKAENLKIKYLGTAGFILSDSNRTLVLDPFISRPNLWQTLTQPLCSDPALVKHYIPYADEVLIGHAHYDHILDAPELCKQTGARLIGSEASLMYGRSAGLLEQQMQATQGREVIHCGEWQVVGLPSIHGKALFGRIPLPGDMTTPPPFPPKFHQLRHGLVLNWWIDTGQLRVVHIDSADFIEQELQGRQADIVCLCAIGRKYRPNYVKDVVRLLKPKYIIPCHWDTMVTPIDAPPQLLPGVNIPEFIEEIKACGVVPLFMPILGELYFDQSVKV